MNPSPINNLDRLAIHTITNKPWPLETLLDRYAAAGVRGVSVWRDRFEELPPPRLAGRLRDLNLAPVSVVRGGFFPAPTAAARQQAIDDNLRAIDEAAAVGAPLVVLVCGAVPGQAITESLSQIAGGLEAALPHAEQCGVCLAIEPLHPMYADSRSAICTMKTANEMAERFASPHVAVAVDVFHVWWDPDLEAEIRRCAAAGNLAAFHVCDWKEDMEEMLNDRGLMGEGVIRIREIRGWMENGGFSGFHEVEIFSNRWWQADQDEFLTAILRAYREHV